MREPDHVSCEERLGGGQSPGTAAQEAVESPPLEVSNPMGSLLCRGVTLLQHRAGGDLQRLRSVILGLFYWLGSAVASAHPQGLRQLSVIAEGAEIVPSLPDPIAGWCWLCFGWSQLRRTLSLASGLFDQGYLGEN